MTEERVPGRLSQRRAALAWSMRDVSARESRASADRTLRTWSDEATGGSGFSPLCWPRNSRRAYSARWMSQLVYNGLSSFGAQNSCVSAALITQGMQRGRRPPSSSGCHREQGSVTRRR
jgi:hypothetical protein